MPLTSGLIAALAAPVLEAVGFLEWDIHWKKGGGSAFALNLYKCTLASFCFFSTATYMNNIGYMQYSKEWALQSFSPWGELAQAENNLLQQSSNNYAGSNSIENRSGNHPGSEQWKQPKFNKDIPNTMGSPIQNDQFVSVHDNNGFLPNANQVQARQVMNYENNEVPPQNQILQNQILTPKKQEQNIDVTNDNKQPLHQQLLSQPQKNHASPPQQHMNQLLSRNLQFFQREENIHLQPPDKIYRYLDDPKYMERYRPLFFNRVHQIPPILLSSFLGIVVGDCAELEALRLIGARRVLIVDTFKPFAAAILGNLMLNEPLYAAAYFGMFLTVVGTYLVLMASLTQMKREKKKKKTASIKRNEYGPKYISDQVTNVNSGIDDFTEHEITTNILKSTPLSRHDLNSEYDSVVDTSAQEADEFMMLFEEERGIANESICCWDRHGKLRRRSRKKIYNRKPEFEIPLRLSSGGSFGSAGSLGAGSWGSFDGIMDMDDDFDADDYETDYFVGQEFITNKKKANPSKVSESFQKSSDPLFQNRSLNSNKYGANQVTKPSGVLKKSRYSLPAKPQSTQKILNSSAIAKESKKLYDETLIKFPPTNNTNFKSSISPTIDKMIISEEINFESHTTGKDNNHDKGERRIQKKDSFDTTSTASTTMMKNIDPNSPKRKIIADKLPPPMEIMRSSSTGSFGSSKGCSIASECGPPVGWYRNSRESSTGRKIRLRTGYALAFLNVILDAYGFVLTKKNGIGMTTWEINLLRMSFAAIIMIALTSFMRFFEWRKSKRQGRLETDMNKYQKLYPGEVEWYKLPNMPIIPWIIVSIGVLFVTFLCPALTNYALMDLPLALAITLTSVTPLYMIPLSWFLKGEKLSASGFFGAFTAVSGVIILCLWGLDSDNL